MQCVALYDYDASEADGLSFRQGNVITIINKLDSGWWDGELDSKRGWFPSNYVTVASHRQSGSSTYSLEYLTQDDLKEESKDGSLLLLNSSNHSIDSQIPLPTKVSNQPWLKKITLDNRFYYYNPSNDLTVWSLNQIDSPPSIESSLSIPFPDIQGPWKLPLFSVLNSLDIALQLCNSNTKRRFVSSVTTVIETVRVLLFSSGAATLSKNDNINDPRAQMLKSNYKSIMANLSKLVLSSKFASAVWPTPDALKNFQISILVLSKNITEFSIEAMNSNYPISELKEPLPTDQQDQNNNADIVWKLSSLKSLVHDKIDSLLNSVKNSQLPAHEVIAQVRLIVTDVGEFLSIADEIPIDDVKNSAMDFKMNRLALFNSISGLVMTISTATNPFAPSNAIDQVVLCTSLVEKGVVDLLISSKNVFDEKEQREFADLQKFLEKSTKSLRVPLTQTIKGPMSAPIDAIVSSESVKLSPLDVRKAASRSLADIKESSSAPLNSASSEMVSASSDLSIGVFEDSITMRKINEKGISINIHSDHISLNQRSNSSAPDSANLTSADSGRNPRQSFDTIASTPTTSPDKWYLKPEHGDAILFTSDKKVKCGTLIALVEHLTSKRAKDAFVQSFLLTYRSFTNSIELFELLRDRYLIAPPDELEEDEFEEWHTLKREVVREKVSCIIKTWVETYLQDSEEDRHLLKLLKHFCSTTMIEEGSVNALELVSIIEKRENEPRLLLSFGLGGVSSGGVLGSGKSTDAPAPILPRNLKKIKFLDLDPLEIARQLTLLESAEFNKIQPIECLKKAWSQKDASLSPNIKMMIAMSNHIAGWVSITVLSEKDVRKRGLLLKHFVSIADKCRVLNNFTTLNNILAGLNSAPIHRLKRTWDMVPSSTMKALENLRTLMSHSKNFSKYREALHSSQRPCLPYLGLYLTDLTFIQDGSPDILSTNQINFFKRMKTAEIIREIQGYQTVYRFTFVSEIQKFLALGFGDVVDEKVMYDKSLELEPRERDDEKIARMLSETGFL